MTREKGYLVERVSNGSVAETAGIKPGWRLLRIDNRPVEDIIDYKINEADDRLFLLFMTENGILRRIRINKNASTPLGLSFDPPTMAPLKRCRNRCVFCFVDQNPPGLRTPLYVKDDDYRLSFLYGNFITLNRLEQSEMERIIRLQLSPLYVSVHSTDPELRRTMFGTKCAEQGIINLRQLIKAGIQFHVQIVICPGYNTGENLRKTIQDLDSMGPGILSIALVPVGLTAHRDSLPSLEKVTPELASDLIDEISGMQNEFLKRRNSRFVFLADEFYNLIARSLPEAYEYEGYPQLENGVGFARIFLDELNSIIQAGLPSLKREITVTLAAGHASLLQLQKMVAAFNRIKGLQINLVPANNQFFGEEVTVSGLLTGRDLRETLDGKEPGEMLFIPEAMVKEGSNLFLDNMTVDQLSTELGIPVYTAGGPNRVLSTIKQFTGYFDQAYKEDNQNE